MDYLRRLQAAPPDYWATIGSSLGGKAPGPEDFAIMSDLTDVPAVKLALDGAAAAVVEVRAGSGEGAGEMEHGSVCEAETGVGHPCRAAPSSQKPIRTREPRRGPHHRRPKVISFT